MKREVETKTADERISILSENWPEETFLSEVEKWVGEGFPNWEKKTKKYYELNMLMYVTLHELAHIFCDEIGHTDKYKAIFKKILKMAEQVGIYDPNIELPKKYCNIVF